MAEEKHTPKEEQKYAIFYSDGSYVESDFHPHFTGSGDPPPARDVQVIVQPHRDIGMHTQSGYDYYVWRHEQGRWVGVDLFGLFDWLIDMGVLFGRTLTQKEFNSVMRHALKYMGKRKTGWLSNEKKPDTGETD